MLRVIQGECEEVMDMLIAEGELVGKIDACITDAPYNISKDNNLHTMQGRQGIDFGEWDKNVDLISYMDRVYTLLKKNGNFVVFSSWQSMGMIEQYGRNIGFDIKDLIRYEKPNPNMYNMDRRYRADCEYAVWMVKKPSLKAKAAKKWTFNPQSGSYEKPAFVCGRDGGKLHPTQKPVSLMEWLVKIHSNPNDIILDPFMGSGSTGVAALQTGRSFIGIERDNGYYETAKVRLDKTICKVS